MKIIVLIIQERYWLDQNIYTYKNLKQSLDLDVDQNDGAQYIKDSFADIIDLETSIAT